MFKRHVYTCPDVIYLRNRAIRHNIIASGVMIVLYGAAWLFSSRKAEEIVETALDNDDQS
jgi:hypothetical protein